MKFEDIKQPHGTNKKYFPYACMVFGFMLITVGIMLGLTA